MILKRWRPVAVVLPSEGYAGIVEGDEAAVGDGDTVIVARQIGQHSLRLDMPAESRRAAALDGGGRALRGRLHVCEQKIERAGDVADCLDGHASRPWCQASYDPLTLG
jgi:hypothetical protein